MFYTVEPGLYERPPVYNAPRPSSPLLFVPVRSFMFEKVTTFQRPLEFVLKVAVEEGKDVFCLGARVLYLCKGV